MREKKRGKPERRLELAMKTWVSYVRTWILKRLPIPTRPHTAAVFGCLPRRR